MDRRVSLNEFRDGASTNSLRTITSAFFRRKNSTASSGMGFSLVRWFKFQEIIFMMR